MSDNGYAGLLAIANGWKTRVEAAEAERDALAERVTDIEGYNLGLANEAHELRQQRDALAAHVGRLSKDADWICYCLAHDYSKLKKPSDKAFSTLQDTLASKPTTSLARLKAQWQADLMEQARRVRNYSNRHDVFEAIPVAALEGELRRQAKESRDD